MYTLEYVPDCIDELHIFDFNMYFYEMFLREFKFKTEISADTKLILLMPDSTFPENVDIDIEYLYLFASDIITSGKLLNVRAKRIGFDGYKTLVLDNSYMHKYIKNAVLFNNAKISLSGIEILESIYLYNCKEFIIHSGSIKNIRYFSTNKINFDFASLTNLVELEIAYPYGVKYKRFELTLPENDKLEILKLWCIHDVKVINTKTVIDLELNHNNITNVEKFMQMFRNLKIFKVNSIKIYED
jgi:hypothetical protein